MHKIKSNHIKKVLERSYFSNPKQIEHIKILMKIEEYILTGVPNWGAAISYHQLKEYYPYDYLEILKELKPKEYEEEMKEVRCACPSCDKSEKEYKKEEKELKKWWINNGGLI